MKRHLDIQELVNELKAESLKKKDFVIPSQYLSVENGKLTISGGSGDPESLLKLLYESGIGYMNNEFKKAISLDIMPVAHSQIAEKLNIPKKYYDRISQYPELLDANVTFWLKKEKGNYFLRTFIDSEEQQGVLRAVLSDRFNTIDNFDVLMASLEAIKDSGIPLNIEDCDITDKRFYVRFVAPEIEVHAPELLKSYNVPGDKGNSGRTGIMSGFVISNSEVGHGQFSISPRCLILACKNGMIFKDDAFSKVHLGSRMESYKAIQWSENTKKKNYELIMAQVKDAVKLFISADYLGNKIKQLEDVGNEPISHPIEAIKNACNAYGLSEEKEKSILSYFMTGGQNTAFGLAQAFTFYAHKSSDADEQFELEAAGVEIVSNIKSYDKPEPKKRILTNSN
jgi:hypothetical protein